MNQYTTIITAIDPKTGDLTEFAGPNIPGISFADAQKYCDRNGLGYCQIAGILIEAIPVVDGKLDFDNRIDYTNRN